MTASRRTAWAAAIAVAVVAVAVHYPGVRSQAHFLDDDQYVLNNPLVRHPGWQSIGRFVGEVWKPSTVEGYYQPLTMTSLMLDSALCGQSCDPAVYRRTSVFLHGINAGLLAFLVHTLFRRAGPAVLVGLLFASHPVNVESIIWIADRKTLLATMFALVSMIAYVRYARDQKRAMYLVCVVAFLLALLAKPIVVPLPLLLILLDYWPLRRSDGLTAVSKSLKEKALLLAIALLFAVITYVSQSRSSSTQLPTEWTVSRVPLVVCHNIVFYVREMFWLGPRWPFHPFPASISFDANGMLVGVVGTLLLAVVTVLSVRRTRGLLFAVAFFVAAVLPTLGVIGFTVVIAADKYAYFPSIGIYVALAGLIVALGAPRKARVATAVCVVAVAGLFAFDVNRQQQNWRTDDALYSHVISNAPRAALPMCNYGVIMHDRGQYDQAIVLYDQALRVRPDHAEAHNNKGNTLVAMGKLDEADIEFRAALEVWPDYVDALVSRGYALSLSGRVDEAIALYERALALDAASVQALNNLGNAHLSRGDVREAVTAFERAMDVDPNRADTCNNLAGARVQAGEFALAVQLYERAIQLKPRLLASHYNLGETFHRMGQTRQAALQFRRALDIAVEDGATDAAQHIRARLESLQPK